MSDTQIKIFGSTTYQDLEDQVNKYLAETPGYLVSLKYSITAIEGKLQCSALIRFEVTYKK